MVYAETRNRVRRVPGLVRSFIAFDIDDADVLNQMREAQKQLGETGADLKLVKPENIHITVRFLGNITEDKVSRISREMRQVAFKPFSAEIHGIGAFPSVKSPRVIWAGIRSGADEARSVFQQLEPKLAGLGFKREPRGFNPHITVGRVRSRRNKDALVECLRSLAARHFGVLKVSCVKLKKSVLTPQGPVYSTLAKVCPEE
jgi:2'-5' RNA ligase